MNIILGLKFLLATDDLSQLCKIIAIHGLNFCLFVYLFFIIVHVVFILLSFSLLGTDVLVVPQNL